MPLLAWGKDTLYLLTDVGSKSQGTKVLAHNISCQALRAFFTILFIIEHPLNDSSVWS